MLHALVFEGVRRARRTGQGPAVLRRRGGDLAAAAAVYDEVVVHYTISEGAEHEWTREAKADAARVRTAMV